MRCFVCISMEAFDTIKKDFKHNIHIKRINYVKVLLPGAGLGPDTQVPAVGP